MIGSVDTRRYLHIKSENQKSKKGGKDQNRRRKERGEVKAPDSDI